MIQCFFQNVFLLKEREWIVLTLHIDLGYRPIFKILGGGYRPFFLILGGYRPWIEGTNIEGSG